MRIAVGLENVEARLERRVSRRDFLKFCNGMVARDDGHETGFAEQVAGADHARPSVVYLQHECTGCSEALLRTGAVH